MSFSLADKLYSNKPYEKTVDVFGRKFTFRILGAQEEAEVVRFCGATTFIDLITARRIPTLARAIIAVDGEHWEECEEVKQRLRSDLKPSLPDAVTQELQSPSYTENIVATLYLAYMGVKGEQQAELEDLKKNSAAQSPEPVG